MDSDIAPVSIQISHGVSKQSLKVSQYARYLKLILHFRLRQDAIILWQRRGRVAGSVFIKAVILPFCNDAPSFQIQLVLLERCCQEYIHGGFLTSSIYSTLQRQLRKLHSTLQIPAFKTFESFGS